MRNSVGSDICKEWFDVGSGSCGFNSYCILDDEGKSNCVCPPHYSLIDPTRKFKGCKPDFAAQICKPGGEAMFNFSEIINVAWPLADAEILSPMNEAECKENCLKDSSVWLRSTTVESTMGPVGRRSFLLRMGG